MSSAAKAPAPFSVRDYAALFRRNRNMRLLWTAGVVSKTADWFHYVAVHTLIASYAGGATEAERQSATLLWTTCALQAQMLPAFFLSPVIGVAVDRFSRRTVMIWADIARALLALLFILFNRPEFLAALVLMEAPLAAAAGYFDTAQKALLPDLVSKSELVAANGVLQSTWGITAAAGAALGGVLVHELGPTMAFCLNAATFVASAFLVFALKVERERHLEERRSPRANGNGRGGAPPALADAGGFAEGARYVARRPGLIALVSAKPGWALTGGMILALHTLMGQEVFYNWGNKSLGVGLLHAARGVGGVLGSLLAPFSFAWFGKRPLRFMAIVFMIYGLDYAVISRAEHIVTASLLLVIGTTLSAHLWILPAVVLQQTLPARLRGRVFAIDNGLSLVFLGLSGFAAFGLSRWFGMEARGVAFVAAVGLFLVGVAYWIASMALKTNLDALAEEAALEADADAKAAEEIDAAAPLGESSPPSVVPAEWEAESALASSRDE